MPALGVTVGIGLSFVGLELLLIFIHHMTQSIQVSNITARLAHEALHAIDRLYPAAGQPRDADAAGLVRSWRAAGAPRPLYPPRPGYVQSIDLDRLLDDATRSGLRLHLTACPGDFVAPGDAIAEVWPAGAVDADRASAIAQSVNVRDQRDLTQDVGFAVRQLADIALKALSPGINDPTTAVTSIGYLRAVLDRLASRDLPVDVRQSTDGHAVVVARQRAFRDYVEVFVEIGRVAATNARVADAVLAALATIAATAARRGDDRCVALLREVADTVAAPTLADARTAHDRALLENQLARVVQATRPATDMGATGERASSDHQPATTDTIGAEKGDEG